QVLRNPKPGVVRRPLGQPLRPNHKAWFRPPSATTVKKRQDKTDSGDANNIAQTAPEMRDAGTANVTSPILCRERPPWRSMPPEKTSTCGSRNATEGVPYRCLP